MENASKALIIAGAILLSILLISLGIMVYNNAKGTVNDANLDAETIQSFNSKFTAYCGQRKSASEVNSLLDLVNTNNITAANSSNAAVIDIVLNSNVQSGTHYSGNGNSTTHQYNYVFNNSKKYKLTYTTNTDGFVNQIEIDIQ